MNVASASHRAPSPRNDKQNARVARVPEDVAKGKMNGVKRNPFPWFPWWPPIEETHYLPIFIVGILLALGIAYLVM